jgi:hypothetical protein
VPRAPRLRAASVAAVALRHALLGAGSLAALLWCCPTLLGEATPFRDARWEAGRLELLTGSGWEAVRTIDGVPVPELVRQARRLYGADWKRGFIKHFRRVASGAGAHPLLSVSLGLADGTERREALTSSNRRRAEEAWSRRGSGRAWPECPSPGGPLRDDVDILARGLDEQYAYLERAPGDFFADLAALRCRISPAMDRWDFGLRLQAVLARLRDPHTGVIWSSLGEPPERALPPGAPEPPAEWLSRLAPFVPAASTGFQRWAALRLVRRHYPIAQQAAGLPPAPVPLVRAADEPALEVSPGALKLRSMERDRAFLSAVEAFMASACRLEEVRIDLRDNAGGRRDAAFSILPYLIDAPRVISFAALRTAPEDDPSAEGEPALEDRRLYPVTSPRFTLEERAAIRRALERFRPAWRPSPERFSGWYASVVSPDPERCRVRGRVEVLMNEGSLSATEVLLGALKGLPNVTLVGQPSGGAGGWPRELILPGSGIRVRIASAASFQPDGTPYLGHGVQPDRLTPSR